MSVLVLGGSAFMGKLLVEELSSAAITVNRGNTYWGVPGSPSVIADRRKPELYRSKIVSLIESREIVGVVDFCGYKKSDVQSALPDSLFDLPIPYIFISTDSVYECATQLSDPVVEEDSKYVSCDLKQRDKYGYNKHKCEDILAKRCTRAQLYVLRLPDVLGEFDDTGRLWGFLRAVSSNPKRSPLPSHFPCAFVYSRDVVKFVLKILSVRGIVGENPVVLNLLCVEQPTLTEFAELVRQELKASVPRLCKNADAFYPSTEYRQTRLCGLKAKSLFKFVPTSLAVAIRNTIDWLATAPDLYPEEFSEE